MTTAADDPTCGAEKQDGTECDNSVDYGWMKCGIHTNGDAPMSRSELWKRKQDVRDRIGEIEDEIERLKSEIEDGLADYPVDDDHLDELQDELDRQRELKDRREAELKHLEETVEPEVERAERRHEAEGLIQLAREVCGEAEDAEDYLEESLPELQRAARVVGVAGAVCVGLRKAVRNLSSRFDLDIDLDAVPLPSTGPAQLQGYGPDDQQLIDELENLDFNFQREARGLARVGFREDRPDSGVKAARQRAEDLLDPEAGNK